MGHAHDGNHRVHASTAGHEASVSDVEAFDAAELSLGVDHVTLRVSTHGTGTHLVGGKQRKLIGFPSPAWHAIQEGIDFGVRLFGGEDLPFVMGEKDFMGASGLMDAEGIADSGKHVLAVVGVQVVVDFGLAIFAEGDAATVFVAGEDNEGGHVFDAEHLGFVLSGTVPGRASPAVPLWSGGVSIQ